MRVSNSIYFILISIFLIYSCKEKPENQTSKNEKISLESKYKDLAEFEWLNNDKNFSDENYQDKFTQHFQQSLKENNYENAAAYLIAYGAAVRRTSAFDSIYVDTTLKFFEENQDKISGEAKSHLCHNLGNQFHNLSKLDQSFYWLNKCLEFETESHTHEQIKGFTHFSIAHNYLRKRELDKTEKHLVNALEIFEKVGDIKNQGTVYLLMHNLYVQNRAYDKAEKILQKAIEIFKKEKNDFLAFSAQISYVHFHIEQGDTLKMIDQIGNLSKHAKTYTDITDYHKGILNQFFTFKHIAQKREDSAAYYLNISKEISNRTGIPDLKMRTFFQEILYSNKFKIPLKNPEEVERFYNEMAQNEEPNTQFMYQMAFALYDFHQKNGNYKKANEYSEFLREDTNKQSKDRLKNQLFEMEIKFETERKEKTILLQDKKLADQNKIIFSLIVISVFIVLIASILFIWNKNKSIIKEKNITENYASQLLQKTEDERKRIASDLHDSVSNELVNLRHTIENSNVQLKDKIDNILEEVRNVSRNISPVLFDKIGLKSSIEQLTERIQNQHDFFISSEIEYNGSLENDKELQLYRIIQEAITNILKHANAIAGKVTITEDSKFVNVEIKDNGKGFDVNKMLEKGNCFGLLNITERTKFLNGTVNFQSNKEGTIIKLSIPK